MSAYVLIFLSKYAQTSISFLHGNDIHQISNHYILHPYVLIHQWAIFSYWMTSLTTDGVKNMLCCNFYRGFPKHAKKRKSLQKLFQSPINIVHSVFEGTKKKKNVWRIRKMT